MYCVAVKHKVMETVQPTWWNLRKILLGAMSMMGF